MIKNGEYIILDEDNVEEVMELTGKTEKELRELYAKCYNFGKVQVFWREHNRWWGLQFAGEFEYRGILDDIIKETLIKHRRRESWATPESCLMRSTSFTTPVIPKSPP